MKKMFIVTGRTGAGKSTLCKKLEQHFQIPLLSFAEMGKSFANKQGYHRIRQCHLSMALEEFVTKLSIHILQIIDEQINICNTIIIDGLYIAEVLKKLNQKYDCKIIYLQVDSNIRYKRIAERLNISIQQAIEEEKIKEKLKEDVGIDEFLKKSDVIIDSEKSIDEVFELAKKYIEDKDSSES